MRYIWLSAFYMPFKLTFKNKLVNRMKNTGLKHFKREKKKQEGRTNTINIKITVTHDLTMLGISHDFSCSAFYFYFIWCTCTSDTHTIKKKEIEKKKRSKQQQCIYLKTCYWLTKCVCWQLVIYLLDFIRFVF